MRKIYLYLLVFFFNVKISSGQQIAAMPKPNWYNLDLTDDHMFGISMDKAYRELMASKFPSPVIVAVIDGGLDISHQDLNKVTWVNKGEIPGNGKDDDKNGYADDVYGWNFLGSEKESFEFDNDLIVKEIRRYNIRFGGKDSTAISKKNLVDYRAYISKKHELSTSLKKINENLDNTNRFLNDLNEVLKKIGKTQPKLDDFTSFTPTNESEKKLQRFMIQVLKSNPDFDAYMVQTKSQFERYQVDLNYHLNLNYDVRAHYKKEYRAAKDKFYGNGNIAGTVPPAHGTHVAGIIAAERGNNIGIDGIANAVLLMPIRAIPDGYSDDRDQANAIRYAADNGAKIINMSFGLSVALNRKLVVEAVKYALKKDILFIQAAGNGGENLDLKSGYPNRTNPKDKLFVNNFIKVGASGFNDGADLVVPFSNYGKQSVDVFAPGLAINSTIPGNKYEQHSGTSMAAPVVAGLAAVIREYYPKLKAWQVKEIIVKTVSKRESLQKLCISGGVVNAYAALKLAQTY